MMVAQTSRRNRKTTPTTSTMDSARVNFTSAMEARMVGVRSWITCTRKAAGKDASMRGSRAFTAATAATRLAPGCFSTASCTPRLPFCHPAM